MRTPYKRILVFDLETGGLDEDINPITEIAIVAIDAESLDIIEEFSVMIKPNLDLRYLSFDAKKDIKAIFKNISTKDDETKINSIKYKGKLITLKNLDTLIEDFEEFYIHLKKYYETLILDYKSIVEVESGEYSDIFKLFFDNSYNPEALRVTKISRDMMVNEGLDFEEAFKLCLEMIKRHKVGNNKPVLSGHNIDKFDIPFKKIFFLRNKEDLMSYVNEMTIDTIKWARLKWYNLSSYSLGVCANEVGLTLKEAHRALPDTIANAKFLIRLFNSLRGDGSKGAKYRRRKFKLNY